jgi:DNA-binding NarL/FixJ family response regulator
MNDAKVGRKTERRNHPFVVFFRPPLVEIIHLEYFCDRLQTNITPMPIFILFDPQDITREGLRALLLQLNDSETVMEAASRNELRTLLNRYPAATVVLDYTLSDFSDVELMNMKQRYPQSLWVLFSDELSKPLLRRALQSDQLYSVVMKGDSREEIVAALRNAAAGRIYRCETALQVLHEGVPDASPELPLTTAERLVLHEMALGKTTKEIAYEQHLSFHTIHTHRRNIFRKLEINNVHEATKYALRAGLIDWGEYTI